jgi:DNA-binding response OmpR family regulator
MSKTVLIVEDDIPTCALWARHLTHWGWDVETVNNAEEAEVILETMRPRAIVLDVMLADERSGWDLLAKLRSEQDTEKLPVFIVSAVDEPRRAEREGATGFMLKPCSAHLLAARIAEQLTIEDEQEQGHGQGQAYLQ